MTIMDQQTNAAEGSMDEFAKAADLVEKLATCETKGSYLALILNYRKEVIEDFHAKKAEAKKKQSETLKKIVEDFNALPMEERKAKLKAAGESEWGKLLDPLFDFAEEMSEPAVVFEDLIGFNIYTNWRIPGGGFGQTHASLSSKGNKVLMSMSPEGMGLDNIRSILHAAVDAYINKIDPEIWAKDRYSFRQEVDLPPGDDLIEVKPD